MGLPVPPLIVPHSTLERSLSGFFIQSQSCKLEMYFAFFFFRNSQLTPRHQSSASKGRRYWSINTLTPLIQSSCLGLIFCLKLCLNGSRRGWIRLWPTGLNWQFKAETDLSSVQCNPPLLFTTPTMWFSLYRKQRENGNFLILGTQI